MRDSIQSSSTLRHWVRVFGRCFCIGIAVTCAVAHAEETKEYTFSHNPRNRSLIAIDLHATFSGTGGDLRAAIVANAPGCDDPIIPSNGQTGNTLDIVWPSECIDPGESVGVRISTTRGPTHLADSHWTYQFASGESDSTAIDPERDVTEALVADLEEETEYYFLWVLVVLLVIGLALFLLWLAQKDWTP